jgi:hypothetical protein
MHRIDFNKSISTQSWIGTLKKYFNNNLKNNLRRRFNEFIILFIKTCYKYIILTNRMFSLH